MKHNPVRKLALLSTLLFTTALLAATPATLGYGNTAQWQIGFSGTCKVATICPAFGIPVTGGFWGWCAFGGSDGSSSPGTTGTSADCQITVYLRTTANGPSNPFHLSYDVSSWLIATGSTLCISTSAPCFFFTGGTIEVTGPGASAFGLPTGVLIPLSALCNFSNVPTSIIGNPVCDSGAPAIPGHFSIHPAPGVEFNIQVNKLP